MRLPRHLAGFAAGAVLAAGLTVGVSAPATAGPRPVVFPTCSTMLPARDFVKHGLMYGWSPYTSGVIGGTLYGASSSTLTSLIRAHSNVTCSWKRSTPLAQAASISEVTLTTFELNTLRNYFRSIGVTGVSLGGPALSYAFESPGHPGWIERHTVFPGGTVVFTLDRSGTVNGAMSQDAGDVLIGLNPGINGTP